MDSQYVSNILCSHNVLLFMLECMSICPETAHQKLESQRIYLTLLTMDLYVMFLVKICVGVASTILQFSGKLSKLRTLIFTVHVYDI